MTTLATLVVRITAQTKDYETKLKAVAEIGNKMTAVGSKLSKAVTLPLVAIGTASVAAASNLNESMSKVQVVFGKSAKSIQDFASTAAAKLGMSKQAALEASGSFGNLFTTMGLGKTDAAEMSTGLVKLAADLASFNNLSPEEVLEKLRSGLVGQTEPLRSLGVNLTAAGVQAKAMEMGLADANGTVSQAAMVQARYALILDQTKTAQGDFARTADGMANKMRTAKAQLIDAAATLGEKLLPYAIKAVDFVTRLATAFTNLPGPAQDTVIVVAALAAATGPVLSIFGKLMTVGSNVAIFFKGLAPLISANLPLLAKLSIGLAVVAGAMIIYNEWNRQSTAGIKQVQTAWSNFFDSQIKGGKSAIEIAGAYNQKTIAANKAFNEQSNVLDKAVVGIIKLTQNESKFLKDEEGLHQALLLTAKSADEYWQASILAKGGNLEFANSNHLLIRTLRDQTKAEWDATNGIPPLVDEEGKLTAVGSSLVDSTSKVDSVLKEMGLSTEDAEKKLTALKIATGLLTPEQAQLATDTDLMAKGYATGAISLDRMTQFLKSATLGTSDMTDAERKQLSVLTPLEDKMKDIVSLKDSYTMLKDAIEEANLVGSDMANVHETVALFVNGLDEALNTTTTDMELMSQATAYGIVSASDYANAMFDAKNGTFALSQAEREAMQTSIAAEKAHYEKAEAARNASQAYLELASSLKGATSAQIAETAISQLSEMQKSGAIGFDQYFTAVSGLQETFGLSDAKSRALAATMPILNNALASGILPATSYDEALKALILDAGDGKVNIDNIVNKFAVMPESIGIAKDSLLEYNETMTIVPQSAATAAQGAYDAFTAPNWAGAGMQAGQEIANGITASTPIITAAAQSAIQSAIDAAAAAGASGPTPPSTPPPDTPGYATGGSGIVPPGYPNDSYLIGLTSGESFTVTPAGASAGETTINVPIVIYGNADEERVRAAARDGVLAAQRASGKR